MKTSWVHVNGDEIGLFNSDDLVFTYEEAKDLADDIYEAIGR